MRNNPSAGRQVPVLRSMAIRGVPESTLRELRKRARIERLSFNDEALRIVQAGLDQTSRDFRLGLMFVRDGWWPESFLWARKPRKSPKRRRR